MAGWVFCWVVGQRLPQKNGVLSGLTGALMGGLIGGLSGELSGGLNEGLKVGQTVGLIGGLIGLIGGACVGSLNRIEPVESISWNWERFWKKTRSGGLIGGLFLGLIGGLIGLDSGLHLGLTVGQIGGLFVGLRFGLLGGLIGGLKDTVRVDKTFPNEEIKSSRNNSAAAFALGSLIFGLVFGLVGGLILGLNRGGSAVVKHYSLRLILWINGYTPFMFIELLDYCAKLILLKKAGGGYIFMHRRLLEYFAGLNSLGQMSVNSAVEEVHQ